MELSHFNMLQFALCCLLVCALLISTGEDD
jgi:hypothetical protein